MNEDREQIVKVKYPIAFMLDGNVQTLQPGYITADSAFTALGKSSYKRALDLGLIDAMWEKGTDE